MSITIYTDFAQSVCADTATEQTIEEIIASIRDGRHGGTVDRIRDTKDDAERQKLKRSTLPVFYPAVRVSQDTRLGEDSIPTGIVQFDIDTKSNTETDFDALRREVIQHPACMYAFTSPSGGLKFGILTDFTRASGETIATTKRRFKDAYKICLHNLRQHCSIFFEDDEAVSRIRQSCYLSHDPDAYFRAECIPMRVNDQCTVPLTPATDGTFDDPSLEAMVLYLLNHIPQKLPYAVRTKVNLCVLYMLGRAGIPLLKNHWQKDDQTKLTRQLEDCLRGADFGSIQLLQSYAGEYGDYKRSTGGWDRRQVKPEPLDYALPSLVSPNEATATLRSIVHEFVIGKQSHFVTVTAGAGKTRTVLEALSRKVGPYAKILFLVPNHKLADEILTTYREIRTADIALAKDLRGRVQRPTMMKMRSRKDLCENEEARE